MEDHARTRSMLEKAEGIHQEPLIVLEEMALSHIEAESSTLKHLERGNHSDCDSDNDSENKNDLGCNLGFKIVRERMCGPLDLQGTACADPWISI